MSETTVLVDNYSTFSTKINVILVQKDLTLLSESYNVIVEFAWTNPDNYVANVSFLKIKSFIEEALDQSIFVSSDTDIDLSRFPNNVILSPYSPSVDILSMLLHAKLTSIAKDDFFLSKVTIENNLPDYKMAFTYSSLEYPILPSMEDFADGDKTHYDLPWWFRDTPETFDYFYPADSDVDLTDLPEYVNIFEEIDAIADSIMNPVEEVEADVIDIKQWKPKVIEDD